MNKIEIDGEQKTAPSTWNEVTQQQLIWWLKVCEKNVEPEMALLFTCSLFYGISKKVFFKLNAAQRIYLSRTLEFLLENKLHRWIIPTIKVGLFKKYIGPQHYLSSSSIKEFSTAETYYHAYQLNKDEAMLDLLIATLYRPASAVNNGKDERALFTEVGVLQQAPLMAKLDQYLRQAILFNYEGARLSVMGRYPTLFKKSDSPSKSAQLPDLAPIIKTMAGGKFGSYRETEHTGLYTFLDHWRDEQEAYEQAKRDAQKR